MATAWTIEEYQSRLGIDDCQPRIGRYVRPDGWSYGNCLEPSDWEEAQYRLPTNSGGPVTSLAVNVMVTGRTVQRDNASPAVRVRIEFVGDGELSSFVSGWMHVND